MEFKHVPRSRFDNSYCGPAAIALLTGMSTIDSAALLRKHSGRRSIKGTYNWVMGKAFADCGLRMQQIDRPPGVETLGAWLDWARQNCPPDAAYLVVAGHHYQVVIGSKFACSQTHCLPVNLDDPAIGRRRKLESVFRITGNQDHAKAAEAAMQEQRKSRRTEYSKDYYRRVKLRRLAKEGKILLETWSDGPGYPPVVRVGLPQGGEDGMASCYDGWDEAVATVEQMLGIKL